MSKLPLNLVGLKYDWRKDFLKYLSEGVLPEEKDDARKVARQASKYVIHEGMLYRRSYTMPLLKCVSREEGLEVLKEIHEGMCGSHIGPRVLALKALRAGFYWPTAFEDSKGYVQKCHKCQIYARVPRKPQVELKPIESFAPFATWEVDLLKLCKAKGEVQDVIVAVDYFTKWVEIKPLPRITEAAAMKFMYEDIICRYGIPQIVITDNGAQFLGARFQDMMREHGISHQLTSVAHPQCNGQVEVTNKAILSGLKKRLDEAKGRWVEELPNELWSYRTTWKTATGESQFSICFGAEVVIPVEMQKESLRVQCFDPEENDLLRRNEL